MKNNNVIDQVRDDIANEIEHLYSWFEGIEKATQLIYRFNSKYTNKKIKNIGMDIVDYIHDSDDYKYNERQLDILKKIRDKIDEYSSISDVTE